MAEAAVRYVVTVCGPTFSRHELMPRTGHFVVRFDETPGPLLVTIYKINAAKKRLQTQFRDWCTPLKGQHQLPSPLHVKSTDGGIRFGNVQDLGTHPTSTYTSSEAAVAAHYQLAADALRKWQADTRVELPGTFKSPLIERITAESNRDPKGAGGATCPPTVDMGIPALKLTFASMGMWRNILRDVARYAETAIGEAIKPGASTGDQRRYAAVGFGGALQGEYYPEPREEDDRELTFGLQMDCDDFCMRVAANIHGLQQAFKAVESRLGLTTTERAILAAVQGQTPLFAVVKARPPLQALAIGHVACILTKGPYTGGMLQDPWLIECTMATEPAGFTPPQSQLCRQTKPGEYIQLYYVATASSVTYFFTKTGAPNTYVDGIPFSKGAPGALLDAHPNTIFRRRAAEANPAGNVGQGLRQATNWDNAVRVGKEVLGGAVDSTAPARVTATMHSWDLKVAPGNALFPLMGWGC